jgi:hypothetical protein
MNQLRVLARTRTGAFVLTSDGKQAERDVRPGWTRARLVSDLL